MNLNSVQVVGHFTQEKESAIELQGINKHFFDKYDNVIQVIKDITLDIKDKEFISIVGCPQPPSMSVIWPVALTVQLNNGHPQCHRHLQKTTWLSEFKKVHHGSALSIPS